MLGGDRDDVDEEELSDALQLLSDPAYRAVLAALDGQDQRIGLAELAGAVLRQPEWPARASETDPETVAARLHHVHLPKLDATGVVAYDVDDGTVDYRGDSGTLDRLRTRLADANVASVDAR